MGRFIVNAWKGLSSFAWIALALVLYNDHRQQSPPPAPIPHVAETAPAPKIERVSQVPVPKDLVPTHKVEPPIPKASAPEVDPQVAFVPVSLDPPDVPPINGDGPEVVCVGGVCAIDPAYAYRPGEVRSTKEPRIYFEDPPVPAGMRREDVSRSIVVREKNRELRWNLNEQKARLRWTPNVRKYLDLSDLGPCPWDYAQVQYQNKELERRLRQLSLLAQRYQTDF